MDAVKCQMENATHFLGIEECDEGCSALWLNNSGVIVVGHKYCWEKNAVVEHSGSYCEGRSSKNKPQIVWCHCYTDLCTENLTWVGYDGKNIQ